MSGSLIKKRVLIVKDQSSLNQTRKEALGQKVKGKEFEISREEGGPGTVEC